MSTPLGRTVWGFLLAVLDLRINGLDLLPDPVGWLLAAVGLAGVSSRAGGFRVAMVVAGVEVAVSLPLLVAASLPEPLATVDTLLQTGFVFAVCTGLIATLAHLPDRVRAADIIRWTDLGLTGLLLLTAALLGDGPATDLAAAPFMVVLVLAGLAVALWFVILLFRVRGDPAVGGRTRVDV